MVATPNLKIESSHEEFRSVITHFTMGVSALDEDREDRAVGFTCQSFVFLSIDPPLVSLTPSKSSTRWPRIARAESSMSPSLPINQEICAELRKIRYRQVRRNRMACFSQRCTNYPGFARMG